MCRKLEIAARHRLLTLVALDLHMDAVSLEVVTKLISRVERVLTLVAGHHARAHVFEVLMQFIDGVFLWTVTLFRLVCLLILRSLTSCRRVVAYSMALLIIKSDLTIVSLHESLEGLL